MAFTVPSSPDNSNSTGDSVLDEDLEALRRACQLTGTNPNDVDKAVPDAMSTGGVTAMSTGGVYSDSDSSDMDDFDLVRRIQERYSLPSDQFEPLSLKPLKALPPGCSEFSDDDEDDFEILRAIERRCAEYQSNAVDKNSNNHSNITQCHLKRTHSVCDTSIASEQETPKTLFQNFDHAKDPRDACNTVQILDCSGDDGPLDGYFGSSSHHSEAFDSSHTNPTHLFMDAIKKNRLYQKTIRDKVVQVEARMEENRKLKERIKLLKDFQISCKKRTGRALSQKKDARIQLISVSRSRKFLSSTVNDNKLNATRLGPGENSHVQNYRMVLEKFPVSLCRERWSDKERENLRKGINQQFQEAMLEKSMELHRGSHESVIDSNAFDDVIVPIADLEITADNVRAFLPKVNWERLASMYVVGRSGAECESRWLNSEDPLINHSLWTKVEDKKLLYILQERGVYNWIEIATMLGTNRTPYQSLTRYQRSLNAHFIKRDWTEEEDAQLSAAVVVFGENNWQPIASCLEGRTGTQCSNRWMKTLNPARQKVGRWTVEEDKHLKVAVMLFRPRAWNKIAQFVPGRTQVQCRERWLNVLDPSLNLEAWTEEEDSRLLEAIQEHGHCWSKVAASVPPRTDNQCRRRWKVLLPEEVPLLQAAYKVKKTALMSNFVERKEERPDLGPSDFRSSSAILAISGAESGCSITNEKKKTRKRPNSEKSTDEASIDGVPKRVKSNRSRTKSQVLLEGVRNDDLEIVGGDDSVSKKKKARKTCIKNNKCSELASSNPELSKKKKAHKTRIKNNKCSEPASSNPELPLSSQPFLGKMMITNGNDDTFPGEDATPKKKRERKSYSKRNRCIKPAQCHQQISLSPKTSTMSKETDENHDRTLKDTSIKTPKKILRPHSKKTKHIKPAHGCQGHLLSSDPSNILAKANGDNTESFARNEVLKMQSDKNDSIASEGNEGALLCPEELTVSRITSCNSDETFANDCNIPKKRKAPKSLSKRKRRSEPSHEHCDLSFPPDLSSPLIIKNSNVQSVDGVRTLSKRKRVPNRCYQDYE